MQPQRNVSGITLKSLLVVVLVLSVLGSRLVASLTSGRRRAAETRAQAALKQLVSTQHVWRSTDGDRNGCCDYWTRDVAGFYALQDSMNAPLRYISPQIAAADVTPAVNYAGMPVYDPRIGYHIRAMIVDETGVPYVDPSLPPIAAAPLTGLRCTNLCRFAICAWLAADLGRPNPQFIVNEEGVVYGAEDAGRLPTTAWPAAISWPDHLSMPPPWEPTDSVVTASNRRRS